MDLFKSFVGSVCCCGELSEGAHYRGVPTTRGGNLLESFFEWSGLGLCLKYHNDPGHIFSFSRGGAKAGLRVLIIQLGSVGSRGVYYGGSHLHSLPAVQAANGLWEVPFAAFKRVGCREIEVKFEHGGL